MYPHPATIALFGLDKTLKYKKGSFETRQHELLRLMTLIEGLDKATPRLRVNHNMSWVELRKRVEAATLSNGDEVQIGKFRLVFVAGPRPDENAAASELAPITCTSFSTAARAVSSGV